MVVDVAPRIDGCQYRRMPIRKSRATCCAPVLTGSLEETHAEDLAARFRALGDPGRLRLLSFLASQPGGETCVCHLTEPLGLSQPTVSHHLKVLSDAGLLDRERRGTWMYYRLRLDRLEELCGSLAAPKRLATALVRRAAKRAG
jgi:ArsR family transcriptional regulator